MHNFDQDLWIPDAKKSNQMMTFREFKSIAPVNDTQQNHSLDPVAINEPAVVSWKTAATTPTVMNKIELNKDFGISLTGKMMVWKCQ